MKKVTFIISDVDKALAFEWIAQHLNKEKFTLSFILLNPNPSNLEQFLRDHGFEVHGLTCRGKKDWIKCLYQTYRLLKRIDPQVVHCHLIQANIIGLSAAKLSGIKQRIYTRHHSSLHHVYFPKGVWWDKMANQLATRIVAISGIVKEILLQWEKVPGHKVVLIPHGFLLDIFKNADAERVQDFRRRHQLEHASFVVGVISRLTKWKGVQYIIPAFKKFLSVQPDAVLLILNAKGDYEEEIREQLNEITEENYRLIVFEKDVAAAYEAMDVFVHVPIDDHSEAFGQIYVEALASGIPSIFTLAGIAPDFVVDRFNALAVPFKNSEAILASLTELQANKELQRSLAKNGRQSVEQRFDLKLMINALEQLYES